MSRTCVIFNPTARGDKAQTFHRQLNLIAAEATLKPTTAPTDARRLAAEAIGEGFETIVAGGGDGTVNEVLNGIGDANGFEQSRLAVLPLGTVNVFAKELGLPSDFSHAWRIIQQGHETRIDLPQAEFSRNAIREKRFFAQLAGTGLDARAIELTSWQLKKKFGAMAYVLAGFHAFCEKQNQITVSNGSQSVTGELVLIGNGRFYGGRFRFFPRADFRDGLLDVCIFPRASWLALVKCGWGVMTYGMLTRAGATHFTGDKISITSPTRSLIELDGENVGELPATLSVQREVLRIIVP